DKDKPAILPAVKQFRSLGLNILATAGTHAFFKTRGIESRKINKVSEGRPHVADAIKNGDIQLVINTGAANETRQDGFIIRRAALKFNIPYATTIAGGIALSKAVKVLKEKQLSIKSVQEYHQY
ncbi:MAG: carbamoyl phosphate synthase large subunit, partial [Desulfobacteraceae bacterium]